MPETIEDWASAPGEPGDRGSMSRGEGFGKGAAGDASGGGGGGS